MKLAVGPWPDAGVTFDVTRGSFVVPADMDADEIPRHYARNIPEGASLGRRERLRGGRGVRVYWHIIRVVVDQSR